MRATLGFGLAALFTLVLALPAWAHHAHGNYVGTFSDIQGVVKEVHFLNPHSWVYLDVKNAKGEVETWAIEATGKMGLQRVGVDTNYIHVGDVVKARCHFLKDGSTGCLAGFLKLIKDGSVKDWDGGNDKPEGDF